MHTIVAALLVVYISRIRHGWRFLVLNLLTIAILVALTRWRTASRILRVIHDWFPVWGVLAIYFEAAHVIPVVNPFSTYSYDHALEAIDVSLLGDPAAFFARGAFKPLSDALMVCYLAYYPFVLIVPFVAYLRGDEQRYSLCVTVIVTAFVVCYIGYFLVPAVGPHRLFEITRVAELDGYGVAERGYQAMLRVPNEPPDAFPSGHTMMGILVPLLAWRVERRLLLWLLPVGAGIIVSTLYFRFHYVADVGAAIGLAPLVWWVGTWLAARAPVTNPAASVTV